MSYGLRVAAAVQLIGLVFLGIFDWESIGVLAPLRWPLSGLIWLAPFLWLLRSPELAAAARRLPLAPLLAWCGWYLVAANWSPDQQPAVAFSLGVLSTVLAGYWFTATFGWLRFCRLAAATIGVFLLTGLLYRAATGLILDDGRFEGIGNNPTDTGRHAATMALLGWGGFVGRRRWQTVFLLAGLGFTALAVAKTALVGLVAAGALLGYRSALSYQRSQLLAGAAASFVILATVLTLATGASEPTADQNGTQSALTLTGRTQVWADTLEVINDRPILGHGTGSSTEIFGTAAVDGELSWRVTNAHNLWLQSLLEHGVLGISLLIATFVALVSRCKDRPEASRDAVLVLLAINSMTETLVQFPSMALLVVAAAIGSVSSPRSTRADLTAPKMAGVAS